MEPEIKAFRKAIRALHSANYHPIWEPGSAVFINGEPHSRLGDYGRMLKGVFNRIGNISDLKLSKWPRSTSVVEGAPAYCTGGARITRIEGGAKINSYSKPDVSGEIKLEFDKKYSVWIARLGVKKKSLDNLGGLSEKLLANPTWSSNFEVITSVCLAECIQVIITTRNNTSCTLSGNAGDLDALVSGTGTLGSSIGISIADASAYSNGLASGPYACTFHRMKKTLLGKQPRAEAMRKASISGIATPGTLFIVPMKIEPNEKYKYKAVALLNGPLSGEQDIPD